MSTLVILSHTDDEVFLAPYLLAHSADEYIFTYLAEMNMPLRQTERMFRRSEEAHRAMKLLSCQVALQGYSFLDPSFNLPDGHFHQGDEVRIKNIVTLLLATPGVDKVLSLALEGGHQDHDVSWAIARRVANSLQVSHLSVPAYKRRIGFNKLPIPSVFNQPPNARRISASPLKAVVLMAKIVAQYRSQSPTWFILFPLLILASLRGEFWVSSDQPFTQAHNSLYEARKKAKTSHVMETVLNALESNHD